MARNKDQLYDKRIVDRNIAKGLASKSDFESHLQSLTDQDGNAERTSIGEVDENTASQSLGD